MSNIDYTLIEWDIKEDSYIYPYYCETDWEDLFALEEVEFSYLDFLFSRV